MAYQQRGFSQVLPQFTANLLSLWWPCGHKRKVSSGQVGARNSVIQGPGSPRVSRCPKLVDMRPCLLPSWSSPSSFRRVRSPERSSGLPKVCRGTGSQMLMFSLGDRTLTSELHSPALPFISRDLDISPHLSGAEFLHLPCKDHEGTYQEGPVTGHSPGSWSASCLLSWCSLTMTDVCKRGTQIRGSQVACVWPA